MKTKSAERVMKKCRKCEVVKSLDEFHKNKNKKDGLTTRCMECRAQTYQANKEEISEQKKQYYQDNKEEILEDRKQQYQDNKEEILEHRKQHYHANREKIREQAKKYFQRNKEKRYKYARNRRANDPGFALRDNVSRAVHYALTRTGGSKHGESVLQYLPYTMEQLKEHLESQFEPWMTWSNRNEWHIDHIIPQSKLPYDSMTHPNFQKAWALENLQPLEAKENMSLGNREKV